MNERALLAGIRENPDDPALRLILADWLDGEGQADRAEFVRLLCRAEAETDVAGRALVELRATTLLSRWASQWLGPLPRERILWDRGTIVLRYSDPDEMAQPLPDHPASAWVTGLALHLPPCLLAQRPNALAACPRSSEIIDLRLERQMLSASRLSELFAALSLPRLRHLSLAANNLGEEAGAILKSFPWFTRLRSFSLSRGGATGGAMRSAPLLLDGRAIRAKARGDDLVRLLVETDGFGLGETLDLSRQGLGDDAIEALAGAPFLARIRRLDLSGNQIGPGGTEALAASPHAANLTELNLANNPVADGAVALAASDSLSQLKRLDLSSTQLGPPGARAVASSVRFANLTDLNLGGNAIGDEGVRALLADDSLPALQRLDLRGASFGLESLEAIRPSRLWAMVQHPLQAAGASRFDDSLEVTHHGANPEEGSPTQRMASVARAEGLRQLKITGNGSPMTSEEMAFLCESSALRGLASLHLNQVGLSGDLLGQLLVSPIVETLHELHLVGTALGPGAGEQLGRCSGLRSLRSLDLWDNELGDGLVALVSGALHPQSIRLGMQLTPETAFEAGLIAGERGIRLEGGVGVSDASIANLGQHLGALRTGRAPEDKPVIFYPAGLELLAKCPERRLLAWLNLCFTENHEALLAALERLTELTSLRGLSVSATCTTGRSPWMVEAVPEEVFRRLVALPWFRSLTHLAVWNATGAEVLAEVKDWSPVSIAFQCRIPGAEAVALLKLGSPCWRGMPAMGIPSPEVVALLKQRYGDNVVSFDYKSWPPW
jgi:uncharacterized protein (TIGR02996 family)